MKPHSLTLILSIIAVGLSSWADLLLPSRENFKFIAAHNTNVAIYMKTTVSWQYAPYDDINRSELDECLKWFLISFRNVIKINENEKED